MKVKITYLLPVEKEIEMSPVDYCKLHASSNHILNGERIFRKILLIEKLNFLQKQLEN